MIQVLLRPRPRPPAAMESLFGSRQPSRKTPRTGGGSDDEGPTLREVLKHLEDMEAKAEAGEARMEARMAALGAALSEHFEQQVLPAFRASVLRDVDERMQGLVPRRLPRQDGPDGGDHRAP